MINTKLVCSLLGSCALGLAISELRVSDRIEAREFVIIDALGAKRAILGVNENGTPALRMFGPNGTEVVLIRSNGNAGHIAARDDRGTECRLAAGINPGLTICGERGARAELRLLQYAWPGLVLHDIKGAPRVSLDVFGAEDEAGDARLKLGGSGGKEFISPPSIQLEVAPDNQMSIAIQGPEQEPLFGFFARDARCGLAVSAALGEAIRGQIGDH